MLCMHTLAALQRAAWERIPKGCTPQIDTFQRVMKVEIYFWVAQTQSVGLLSKLIHLRCLSSGDMFSYRRAYSMLHRNSFNCCYGIHPIHQVSGFGSSAH